MTKVRQVDAVNADGIDRIMFAFFVLTLLLLVQHYSDYCAFNECIIFVHFSPKLSQFAFST